MHLITRDVARLALEAYDKKQLSAQNEAAVCKYRDDRGFACAVGVALTDEQARLFDSLPSSSVGRLVEQGHITTDNLRGLKTLQAAHDDWLGAGFPNSAHFVAVARELAQ